MTEHDEETVQKTRAAHQALHDVVAETMAYHGPIATLLALLCFVDKMWLWIDDHGREVIWGALADIILRRDPDREEAAQ